MVMALVRSNKIKLSPVGFPFIPNPHFRSANKSTPRWQGMIYIHCIVAGSPIPTGHTSTSSYSILPPVILPVYFQQFLMCGFVQIYILQTNIVHHQQLNESERGIAYLVRYPNNTHRSRHPGDDNSDTGKHTRRICDKKMSGQLTVPTPLLLCAQSSPGVSFCRWWPSSSSLSLYALTFIHSLAGHRIRGVRTNK